MPMPEFSSEQSGTAILPSEAMPSPDSGTWAAIKGGAASSLVGTAVTAAKGALGDQTFVPYADAAKEMKDNGYDPSVLPTGGLSRGYLNALQDQQKAIQTDAHNADQAGLRHTNGIIPSWRGIDEFIGGNVADSPLFVLGGGAMGFGLKAAGVGAELGVAARIGVRAGESAGIMSGYDVARKEFGTVPGDKDIGIYDVAHDAMVTGVLGGVFGALGKHAPADTATERDLRINGPISAATKSILQAHENFLQQSFPGTEITSGERSAEHNAAIGGAPNSMHIHGEAADFVLPKGVTADQAKAAIEAKGLPITEWLIEKKGDPHSTGYHIHWGWGDKGRALVEDEVPSYRTNPSKIADEHQQEVSQLETQAFRDAGQRAKLNAMPGDPADNLKQATADALTDHVPDQTQPSGVRPVWQTPEAEQQIARAQAQPEMAPEAQKITEAATQAVNDAKATHAVLNPGGDTSAFDTHMAVAVKDVGPMVDFHEAVRAALECASIKGFD